MVGNTTERHDGMAGRMHAAVHYLRLADGLSPSGAGGWYFFARVSGIPEVLSIRGVFGFGPSRQERLEHCDQLGRVDWLDEMAAETGRPGSFLIRQLAVSGERHQDGSSIRASRHHFAGDLVPVHQR